MFKSKFVGSGSSESNKRLKTDQSQENIIMPGNSSNADPEIDDSLNSNSITVYEDESETSINNKSLPATKNKNLSNLINASFSKRSPLATVSNTYKFMSTKSPVAGTSGISSSASKRLIASTFHVPHLAASVNNSHENYFDKLSDEIILNVIKWLPKKALFRLSLVSHRFRRLCLDESLWIRMDLGNKSLREGAFSQILPRGFVILRLAVTRIAAPIFEPDFAIENFRSKLQYLDLSLSGIDKVSLRQLLSVCRNLKKLSLEHIPLDNDICREIAANVHLEALNLALCEGITSKGIEPLSRKLQSLLTLNISWTSLSTEAITTLVSQVNPKLSRINIAGCRKTMVDQHIEILAGRCLNLCEVDVSDCPNLTATAVNALSKLEKIEYLSFSRCYNISTTAYLGLNSMKSLCYLDIFGLISDNGVKMIQTNLKNIEINKFVHSSVARPTVLPRRTSIWGLRTRD